MKVVTILGTIYRVLTWLWLSLAKLVEKCTTQKKMGTLRGKRALRTIKFEKDP